MSRSLDLSGVRTDREALKNIADFFYESISNFRRNLSDLSTSISHFLDSLTYIEKQLGYQGFAYPENASEQLYARLVERKQVIKKEAKLGVPKQLPVSEKAQMEVQVKPQIPIQPPKEIVPQPIQPISKKQELTVPSLEVEPQASAEMRQIGPPKPGQKVTIALDPQFSSLGDLKTHMLKELKKLRKIMKGDLD
jgi:hypothetical protein